MELAKEMNRVLKISAIPTAVSSEDTCSLEECRCFIMKWSGDLDKLVQQSQSAGQVETRKGAELRNTEDLPEPEGEGLSEGVGQNQGEELNQEEEQRLKDGHDIIMQWARELKTVPENSVSAGEAVEQGLAELVKEWKRGKLRNILPIMEFIMWALIKEEAKGMLKSQNIGAGRCIPDLVWQWIHKASVDSLTLDLDTAHPRLTLPVDGKQVRGKRQDHNNPQRFDYRRCVLGKKGFTSGRHYWELGVGENTFWRLGVSRESAPRKEEFSMTPQQGYWTVGWDGDEDKYEFIALTDPQTPLPLSLKPQKLGVYLDYEEGQLSFYNVETRSHIYTFTDMEFKPNEKLYPFFWTLDEKTDLALVSPGKMNDSSFFLLVWKLILAASVDVTLDPDTAQPELILSAEGKRVRLGWWQNLPDNPERFDERRCVLGRESFTSERRYWQVQVGGNTDWRLGVSRESAERKGGFSMTPQQGYWTVEWSRDRFTALTDPQTPLPRSLKPQNLGVYLDYEEGQLSFYNVETRSHIYTFTDMEFNPNEKLYPLFWTGDENTDLS
ncbi:E3 ubiquitin-protein ligase TRIM39-like [Acipenser ruthenus]|uniref:E3 ubiquitin-protein ligase TRIM39-like n=1 Tax=Acipenser ruthenus TaxID=7906 RepID=UPI002741543F|nr:E3 ubiquitin-protein ligase TRIM39-like [Acipenser ruthenus]